MTGRLAAIGERLTKLETAAALFDEHRQSWVRFSNSTTEMNEQSQHRDAEERKKRQLDACKTRGKTLWEQLDLESFPDHQPPLDQKLSFLKRGLGLQIFSA